MSESLNIWVAVAGLFGALVLLLANVITLWLVLHKTEVIHKALNSQLDAFKSEAATQYANSLQQGIELVRLEAESVMTAKLNLFTEKLVRLELKLDSEREKAVVLAAEKMGMLERAQGVERPTEPKP